MQMIVSYANRDGFISSFLIHSLSFLFLLLLQRLVSHWWRNSNPALSESGDSHLVAMVGRGAFRISSVSLVSAVLVHAP